MKQHSLFDPLAEVNLTPDEADELRRIMVDPTALPAGEPQALPEVDAPPFPHCHHADLRGRGAGVLAGREAASWAGLESYIAGGR